MKLLVASKNQSKLKELTHLIKKLRTKHRLKIELVSLNKFPHLKTIREDGKTFRENAIKKAIGYAKKTGLLTLAEDSGLVVDALNGRPGVYSARFAGGRKDDLANCRKVLRMLKQIKNPKKRRASFRCTVAICTPDRVIKVVNGNVTGQIARDVLGPNGFGYDPIMYYPAFGRTFGQVHGYLKNSVSHRSKALKKAALFLNHYLTDKN